MIDSNHDSDATISEPSSPWYARSNEYSVPETSTDRHKDWNPRVGDQNADYDTSFTPINDPRPKPVATSQRTVPRDAVPHYAVPNGDIPQSTTISHSAVPHGVVAQATVREDILDSQSTVHLTTANHLILSASQAIRMAQIPQEPLIIESLNLSLNILNHSFAMQQQRRSQVNVGLEPAATNLPPLASSYARADSPIVLPPIIRHHQSGPRVDPNSGRIQKP
jgi:hypothetical protein